MAILPKSRRAKLHMDNQNTMVIPIGLKFYNTEEKENLHMIPSKLNDTERISEKFKGQEDESS